MQYRAYLLFDNFGDQFLFFFFAAPNQSSTENKINLANLGAAPQDGSPNNINMDPDNKGFYENLPFHGMQNPPNKVYIE